MSIVWSLATGLTVFFILISSDYEIQFYQWSLVSVRLQFYKKLRINKCLQNFVEDFMVLAEVGILICWICQFVNRSLELVDIFCWVAHKSLIKVLENVSGFIIFYNFQLVNFVMLKNPKQKKLLKISLINRKQMSRSLDFFSRKSRLALCFV